MTMAFVTKNVIPGKNISPPLGHSQLTKAPDLVSVQITEKTTLVIPAAPLVATDVVTAFDNLFDQIGLAVDDYITETLGVHTDPISVDYNVVVEDIAVPSRISVLLNDATRTFLVSVTVQIRIY